MASRIEPGTSQLWEYCQLRSRSVFMLLKDVSLITRKNTIALQSLYGDSTLLVLNETSLNSINTLLVLSRWCGHIHWAMTAPQHAGTCIRTTPHWTIPHQIHVPPTQTIPHQDDYSLGQLPTRTIPQSSSPLWRLIPPGQARSCPDEAIPGGELSWWGVVLVGSHPGGEHSWLGIVLVGNYPGGESSGWELSWREFSNGELS